MLIVANFLENIEFTRVKYDTYWRRKDSQGFRFRWAAKNIGFGELTFWKMSGATRWLCDNECCYQPFPTMVLKYWLEHSKWKRKTNTRMMKKRLDVPAIVREMIEHPDSYTCIWNKEDGTPDSKCTWSEEHEHPDNMQTS